MFIENKLNIVKMSAPLNSINTIPVKITASDFVDTNKHVLKFI